LLLFDQNISFRIKKTISNQFPDSFHISDISKEIKSDKEIWDIAKQKNLAIVTFDIDFYDFSIVWGHPPKIILVRSQNQTTQFISELLYSFEGHIKTFLMEQNTSCLEIIQQE
jgi:predicted nuclease of predicted toxin-antitoxin system